MPAGDADVRDATNAEEDRLGVRDSMLGEDAEGIGRDDGRTLIRFQAHPPPPLPPVSPPEILDRRLVLGVRRCVQVRRPRSAMHGSHDDSMS